MDYNWLTDCEKFHRRDFLRVGVLSLLGLSLSKYYALADSSKKLGGQTSGTADSAILIWLAGGPSHIDTFDPKPNAPLEIRGTFKAIGTNVNGIQMAEHLPQIAEKMDHLCLARSVTRPTRAQELRRHYR